MESFKIGSLIQSYNSILYKSTNQWDNKRIFINVLLPLIIAFIVLCTVSSIDEIKESVSLILSILIGLLFNFMSGFSDRINSEHLFQNASEKIKRLNLIKETSDGAFVTILLSLFGLAIILFLTFITNNILFKTTNIEKAVSIIFGSFVLTVLYQIFLMLIFMINRLRKLINVDTDQEKQYLEALRKKELDEWEEVS